MIDNIQLSAILYWIDPANTSCKENDIEDEYDGFSSAVAQDVEERGLESFTEVLNSLYFEFFGVELDSDVAIRIVKDYLDATNQD